MWKSLWKVGVSVVLCVSSSVVCDVRLSSGAFSLLSVCVVTEFPGVGGWLREWICVILMIASVILILQECCFLTFFWGWSLYGGDGLLSQPIFCWSISAFCCCVGCVYGRWSSGEYALASTVSPKRRGGVISFLIHLLVGSLVVEQRCPFYVLVCCDVWVVDRWRHWLRSNNLLFCVVCRKCRIWVVCLHFGCSARCFCGFAFICPFSFFGIQLYNVRIFYSKSSILF